MTVNTLPKRKVDSELAVSILWELKKKKYKGASYLAAFSNPPCNLKDQIGGCFNEEANYESQLAKRLYFID